MTSTLGGVLLITSLLAGIQSGWCSPNGYVSTGEDPTPSLSRLSGVEYVEALFREVRALPRGTVERLLSRAADGYGERLAGMLEDVVESLYTNDSTCNSCKVR